MPCLDCGKPTGGRPRCPDHQKLVDQRRAAKSKAHGLTTALWRRVRENVLERAGGRCGLRRPGCTGRATTVHRLPEFGTVHDENLAAYVSACAHCHGVVDGARAHASCR